MNLSKTKWLNILLNILVIVGGGATIGVLCRMFLDYFLAVLVVIGFPLVCIIGALTEGGNVK